MSNCPNFIDNIKTKHVCIADPDMEGNVYHANIIQDNISLMSVHDNFRRLISCRIPNDIRNYILIVPNEKVINISSNKDYPGH